MVGPIYRDRSFRDFEVFIVLTVLYILIVFGYKAAFNLINKNRFSLVGCKMTPLLEPLFGTFHANMLTVLVSATQWTIYLSLTAFIGGGIDRPDIHCLLKSLLRDGCDGWQQHTFGCSRQSRC